MNKANLFKRKTHSHNENITPDKSKLNQTHKENNSFRTTHHHSFLNQNSIHSLFQNTNHYKYTSPAAKRIRTQPFQIQPFTQIDNILSFTAHQQNKQSFIKTKRAKLYPKIKPSSSAQKENQYSVSRKNSKFETNFQILKKEIQQLESLQILKGCNGTNQQNPELLKTEPYERTLDTFWKQDEGFIASKQFSCGKNISLLEKQRQNIKKVMKNKKFRNYINLYKKNNDHPQKEDNEDSQIQNNRSLSNEKTQKLTIKSFMNVNLKQPKQSSLLIKSQQLKKKQTPQIVKRYYSPQSCNNKRDTPINNSKSKSIKLQLTNYMSFNSISKSSQKKKFQITALTPSDIINQNKKHNKNKELVIIYI